MADSTAHVQALDAAVDTGADEVAEALAFDGASAVEYTLDDKLVPWDDPGAVADRLEQAHAERQAATRRVEKAEATLAAARESLAAAEEAVEAAEAEQPDRSSDTAEDHEGDES